MKGQKVSCQCFTGGQKSIRANRVPAGTQSSNSTRKSWKGTNFYDHGLRKERVGLPCGWRIGYEFELVELFRESSQARNVNRYGNAEASDSEPPFAAKR